MWTQALEKAAWDVIGINILFYIDKKEQGEKLKYAQCDHSNPGSLRDGGTSFPHAPFQFATIIAGMPQFSQPLDGFGVHDRWFWAAGVRVQRCEERLLIVGREGVVVLQDKLAGERDDENSSSLEERGGRTLTSEYLSFIPSHSLPAQGSP